MIKDYEEVRNNLIYDGFLSGTRTSKCVPIIGQINKCIPCFADGVCTKLDIISGNTTQIYMTKYKKK